MNNKSLMIRIRIITLIIKIQCFKQWMIVIIISIFLKNYKSKKIKNFKEMIWNLKIKNFFLKMS